MHYIAAEEEYLPLREKSVDGMPAWMAVHVLRMLLHRPNILISLYMIHALQLSSGCRMRRDVGLTSAIQDNNTLDTLIALDGCVVALRSYCQLAEPALGERPAGANPRQASKHLCQMLCRYKETKLLSKGCAGYSQLCRMCSCQHKKIGAVICRQAWV